MTLLLLNGKVFHASNRVGRAGRVHAALRTGLALLHIGDDLAYMALPIHLARRALRRLREALRTDTALPVQLFECLGALG